jgi:hypothetical protein
MRAMSAPLSTLASQPSQVLGVNTPRAGHSSASAGVLAAAMVLTTY